MEQSPKGLTPSMSDIAIYQQLCLFARFLNTSSEESTSRVYRPKDRLHVQAGSLNDLHC